MHSSTNNNANNNLIKLKLKKPKSWNWELSTSKSSSSIQFPEIQLYDSNEHFLMAAKDANLVIRSNTVKSLAKKAASPGVIGENVNLNHETTARKHYPVNYDMREYIKELSTKINSNGFACLVNIPNDKNEATLRSHTFNYKSKPKAPNQNGSSSLKQKDAELDQMIFLNEPTNMSCIKKSKSTTLVSRARVNDSQSKDESNKKKYRRTRSTNSSMRFSASILERISVKKLSSSSTDSQSNDVIVKDDEWSCLEEPPGEQKKPRYQLRTSQAGTLIVCTDSFRGHNNARRHRNNVAEEVLDVAGVTMDGFSGNCAIDIRKIRTQSKQQIAQHRKNENIQEESEIKANEKYNFDEKCKISTNLVQVESDDKFGKNIETPHRILGSSKNYRCSSNLSSNLGGMHLMKSRKLKAINNAQDGILSNENGAHIEGIKQNISKSGLEKFSTATNKISADEARFLYKNENITPSLLSTKNHSTLRIVMLDDQDDAADRQGGWSHHIGRDFNLMLNDDKMGSNISRQSDNGLQGQKTPSSENLFNKHHQNSPNNGRKMTDMSISSHAKFDSVATANQEGAVSKMKMATQDGYKCCKSFPKHVDEKCLNGCHALERTLDDDFHSPPPVLPIALPPTCERIPHQDNHNYHQQPEMVDCKKIIEFGYSFITPECCFPVQINKSPRGLGLSVSGGTDTNAAYPGLIRIKRLFPHQVAWSTGMLQQGDILLEANKVPLIGLTNNDALEILRATPEVVNLIVCRPHHEHYQRLSPAAEEAPRPPQRCLSLNPNMNSFSGEFEIIMVKQHGSLGFTLRKEDESVLGHCVRALVRQPATTDGRIRPGDKIVAVNDVSMCSMTHEEAVIFLRMAAETVKIRLYRDEAHTPAAATSPSCDEYKTLPNGLKPKMSLRPEALNLLTDIAQRNKKHSTDDADKSSSSMHSNKISPRRLKRGMKNSQNSTSHSDETGKYNLKNSFSTYHNYIVTSQPTSVYSDSETSNISQWVSPERNVMLLENLREGEFVQPNWLHEDNDISLTEYRCKSNLERSSSSLRDPNFVSNNATIPNQLKIEHNDSVPVCDMVNINTDASNFGYHANTNKSSDSLILYNNDCESKRTDCEQQQSKSQSDRGIVENDGAKTPTGTECKSSNQLDKRKSKPDDKHCSRYTGTDSNGFDTKCKVITVELHRRWNSRLGFSLQGDAIDKNAFISAIYNNSVAARDGRLKVGDQLIMVNEDSLEGMATTKAIELLRIIPGSVVLTIKRTDVCN